MNDKIKAQFFAQYLGQNIYSAEGHESEEYLSVSPAALNWPIYGYLLLRTVDQLTDDEIINLSITGGVDIKAIDEENPINRHTEFGTIEVNYWNQSEGEERENYLFKFTIDKETCEVWDNYGLSRQACYQYLLRIGILIPFTYLNDENKPVTLTTDEIIALGWAKIKEA